MLRQFFDRRLLRARGFKRRFLWILLAACLPFLITSMLINLAFLRAQRADAEHVVYNLAIRSAGSIESYYRTASSLAQTLSISSKLQDDILSGEDIEHSWYEINRNILDLRLMIRNYLFIDEITGIHFYLGPNLVIPNNAEFFSLEDAGGEDWFADLSADLGMRRLYASRSTMNTQGLDALSVVLPLRNPHDYTENLGYLRIDLSLTQIGEVMEGGYAYKDSSCYLVDTSGRVILSRGDSAPLDLSLLTDSEDTGYINENHTRYLYARSSIEGTDMELVYFVPRASIDSAILTNALAQTVLFIIELISLVVIMAAFAYSLMRGRDNQLKLLNYQINPHFLYNALDMINWKAIDQGIPEIYRPIQALSRFYKITLNHGQDFITVGSEMEQLRLYLDLQNMRFTNSIRYSFDVDPELNSCVILHMVLQPILENSVLHGIQETERRSGSIHISCQKDGRDLLFSISDDGVGMDPSIASSLLSIENTASYGLANIQERIRLCYGERYKVTIQSAPGIGTTVHVALPILKNDNDIWQS